MGGIGITAPRPKMRRALALSSRPRDHIQWDNFVSHLRNKSVSVLPRPAHSHYPLLIAGHEWYVIMGGIGITAPRPKMRRALALSSRPRDHIDW
jgi:hypothetical protein